MKVDGSQKLGALSDGDGRFEIHGVPTGVQTFEAKKPGFRESESDDEEPGAAQRTVRVGSGMQDLSFQLSPLNAIYGHVTLSTGAPAVGIGLTLVRQSIEDGRAAWQEADRHQATPDGAFRFSGLRDGTYLLMTQPAFDNESAAEPKCTADDPAGMTGFAAEFYSNAQELTGAARIVVSGGQGAEANLALNVTRFHMVEATLVHAPAGAHWEFTHSLLDHGGQAVEYPVHEEKDHTLCAYLPDGSYTLTVQASNSNETRRQAGSGEGSSALTGLLEFSVEGQAARNLRVPLAPGAATQVQVRYEPGPPEKATSEGRDGDPEPLGLSATRVDFLSQKGQGGVEAAKTGDTTYELETDSPGAYWIHVTAGREGECVGAVSAGGQNLAHVPWMAGPSGAGTPIDVVLRTDCARLTVQVPAALAAEDSGEEAFLQVYAVPEFDSMAGVSQVQLEVFGERTATLADLTPGTYRVFAFRAARSVEFRNPAAMERLGSGQEVTLGPRGHAALVLEGVSK